MPAIQIQRNLVEYRLYEWTLLVSSTQPYSRHFLDRSSQYTKVRTRIKTEGHDNNLDIIIKHQHIRASRTSQHRTAIIWQHKNTRRQIQSPAQPYPTQHPFPIAKSSQNIPNDQQSKKLPTTSTTLNSTHHPTLNQPLTKPHPNTLSKQQPKSHDPPPIHRKHNPARYKSDLTLVTTQTLATSMHACRIYGWPTMCKTAYAQ